MNASPDERQCPFCGGTIKAAAMYCKHCRRDVSLAPLSPLPPLQPLPTPPPRRQLAAAPRPPIVEELRAFLVERGAVDAPTFEQSVPAESILDAAHAIAHLGLISVLAEAQLDNIRDAFRASQIARVREILGAAQTRGLLAAEQVEKGVSEFGTSVFSVTPAEFVVRKGYLTAAQVPSGVNPPNQPSAYYAAPPPNYAAAPAYAAQPPSVAAGASQPGAPGNKRKLLIAAGVGVALIAGYSIFGGTANIETTGPMDGYGRGTATFTNRGNASGSVCGQVVVRCSAGTRRSERFCSGRVEPNESRSVPFQVVGMEAIIPLGRVWTNDCEHDFVRER